MLRRKPGLIKEWDQIKPGDNLCLLYKSEEEWKNGVIPFLVTGINQGEMCLCISTNHSLSVIESYLNEFTGGLTPQQWEQLMIVPDASVSQPGGPLSFEQLMDYIVTAARLAHTKGFKGLRFTVAVDWILEASKNRFENAAEYALRLNNNFFMELPITVLCRCAIEKLNDSTINNFVRTHPWYLRNHKIYHNSNYILPVAPSTPSHEPLNGWFSKLELEQKQKASSRVQFLADALEHCSQPFCACLATGKIVAFNKAFYELLGYHRAEMIELGSIADLTPREWHKCDCQATKRLYRTGKPQRFEKEFLHKNGSRIPVAVLVDWIKSHNEQSLYCYFLTDITERKHSEILLQKSEEKYRALFNNMHEGWALYDVIPDVGGQPYDFRYVEVNPGYEKQSGLKKQELIGHTLREMMPQIDTEWMEIFQKVALEQKPMVFQKYSHYFKKHIEVSIFCPSPNQIAVVSIDITKMKHLEQELQEQLNFLQNLIDTIPNPVFYKDTQGVYQGCNKAFESIMNRPIYEIIGKTYHDIAPYEIAEAGWKKDQQLLANGEVQCYDGIMPYADGTLHDVIYNKAAVLNMNGKCTGLVGVTVDITQRKRAEEALSISEMKFRNIFSQSPIGIAVLDQDGIPVDTNRACLEIFGVSSLQDLAGFRLFNDPHLSEEAKQKLINGEVVRYEGELNFDMVRQNEAYNTRKSGYAYFDYLISPLKSEPGIAGGFLVQMQDVTEQRESALALRHSETQLRRITGTMRDIICQTNIAGMVQYVSPSFKTILGYEPAEIIGRNIWSFTHPEDLPRVIEESRRGLCNGSYGKIEFRCRHQNGHYIWLEAVGNPLWDEHGNMIGIVFGTRDITERKHLEKEMARLDRLRLAGQMAATIGHEIRNPMTTVHGFLQMLKSEPECSKFHSCFELMIEELNAANSIISEFLSLAKDKAIYLKDQNLNAIVKNIYPLIAAEAIKSDKQVKIKLHNIANTGLDCNEIRQLILNLALNGLEAMEPGGTLQLSTYMHKDQIVLAVKDQGNGINPAVFDKLGTPFVTTKENGTGLGLAVCYSIADRHHANIEYKTGPSGTTFMIKFKPTEAQTTVQPADNMAKPEEWRAVPLV